MKITSINNINLNLVGYNFKKQSYNSNQPDIKNYANFSYPQNYYLSFEGKRRISAGALIDKIGAENFPSPKIVQALENIKYSKDYSLYEIHKEYYKDLLDCETLEEAKELYPEFADVIDARDLDDEVFAKRKTLQKIAAGQIEGVNIENLSLYLLKKDYGNLYSISRQQEHYFNCSHDTVYNILDELNIKRFSKQYGSIIPLTNPKTVETLSQYAKKMWAEDDGTLREQVRQMAGNILHSSEVNAKRSSTVDTQEHKALFSEAMRESWSKDDGTRREKVRNNAKKVFLSPEVRAKGLAIIHSEECREKKSKAMKKFYKEHPEYIEAQKLAWKRHPEITDKMSEIAQKYPMLGNIFDRLEKREEISDAERKMLLLYYKECNEVMPNRIKIVSQEYRNILISWGLIEK